MECIVCMNSDDVLEYNHCGKYKICNECLSIWKKEHKNRCIICNKVVKGFSLNSYYETFFLSTLKFPYNKL